MVYKVLLPWQLNFSKNRAVWREWANWHVVEFTEQSAYLKISSNTARRKNFPAGTTPSPILQKKQNLAKISRKF